MAEKWSIHQAMDGADISRVMEWRETALGGRKFGEQDMIKDLREIAYRFLSAYRGDFAWLMTQQEKLGQYGKLFDSALAGILNCMVKSVETELQQTVRAEIHKRGGPARPGSEMGQGSANTPVAAAIRADAAQKVPDGLYRGVLLRDNSEYTFNVQDGVIVAAHRKKKGLKLNMGARPVVGELFSDEDMQEDR